MNQLYAEAGVKKKENSVSILLKSCMVAAAAVGVFLITLSGLFMIIGVVIVAAVVFFFPRLNVEYEYVFVDGQIDFDRIVAKSKRKTILRVDMEQTDMVAPKGSRALDGFKNMTLETKDFSSGSKISKPYVIIASVDGKKYQIFFEPSEKMLTMMKQKSPRKISML